MIGDMIGDMIGSWNQVVSNLMQRVGDSNSYRIQTYSNRLIVMMLISNKHETRFQTDEQLKG